MASHFPPGRPEAAAGVAAAPPPPTPSSAPLPRPVFTAPGASPPSLPAPASPGEADGVGASGASLSLATPRLWRCSSTPALGGGQGAPSTAAPKRRKGGAHPRAPTASGRGGERVVGNSPSPRRGARPPRKVPFGEGPLSAPEIQLGAPTLDSLHPSSTPHSSGRGASRISSRSQAPNAGPALEVPSGATGAPEAKAAQALLGSAGGRAAGLRDWGGVRKESWRGPRLGAGGTSGREAGRGIRTYSGGESLGSWGWGRVLQGPDLEGTRPWSWGESPSKELGEGRRRARI